MFWLRSKEALSPRNARATFLFPVLVAVTMVNVIDIVKPPLVSVELICTAADEFCPPGDTSLIFTSGPAVRAGGVVVEPAV